MSHELVAVTALGALSDVGRSLREAFFIANAPATRDHDGHRFTSARTAAPRDSTPIPSDSPVTAVRRSRCATSAIRMRP